MLHDLLKRQLEELGIHDPTTPPDAETWGRLLGQVSVAYDQADDRRLYQALFDQTNDAVFILDLQGKYLAVNGKAAGMLGYTVLELVNLPRHHLVAPGERVKSDIVLETLLAGKPVPPYERIYLRKDGTEITVEINAELVRDVNGNPLYIQSVCRDITERKQAEIALRASEGRYRTLVSNIPNLVVLMFDQDLRYILVEGALFKHKTSKDTFEGKTLWEVYPPERAAFFLPYYQAAFEGRDSRFDIERDGSIYGIHIVPVKDEHGQIIAGMYISEDVTDQRRAESAIHFQAALIDHMHDAVIATDMQFRILIWNPAAERMYGWSADEVLGKNALEVTLPDLPPERQREISRVLNDTNYWEGEIVHRHRSGTPLDVLGSLSLLRDKNGEPSGLIGIDRDITSRHQAERELAYERDLLQALLDNFPDLMYFKDTSSRFIRVNKAQATRLGCADPAETLGKTDFDYFPQDVAAAFYAEEQRIVETGESVISRLEYDLTPDGHPRWLSATKVPVLDKDGKVATIVGITRDVTAMKLAEDALRYQATLLDHISDAVYSTDLDENILTWNRAAERMYGWGADEAIGHFAGKMVGSHMTMEQRQTAVAQILDTGHWEVEIVHTSRAGRTMQVSVSTTLLTDGDGHPIGFIAVSRDITERKLAQEALRQNEEKYRQLFNATQWQAQELTLLNRARAAVAQEMDLAPLIRTIVKAIAEIFNYTHVSLYLLEGDDLIMYHQIGYEVPYPIIPLNKGIIGRTARLGEPAFVEHITDDPDYLSAADGIVAEICVPLFDRDRAVGVFNIEATTHKLLTNDDLRLMIALSEQVSIAIERARLYTSLRESKEQYQNVLDSVREVIFQTDERGCWSFLNPAWVEITGFSLEESLGRSALDIVHPDDRALTAGQYRPLVKAEIPFSRYETRILTKDGETRWVEVHARPTAYVMGQMRGLSGTLTDITERKRSEQQAAELLVQSRTVDALRRFLNNMSHDLRTPLSVINTSLYLVRRKLADPEMALRHLDVLQAQVTHLARLVEDLVEMSRLDDQIVEFEFISVHLGNLVRDVLVSYETLAQQKQLTFSRECEADLPLVQVDQQWVGRLVSNLVTNAIQYTPSGGTISLKICAQAGGVMLEIQDTGIGISPEDLPYIFDRFYRADTARPVDKGSVGLGLAIVRKVVDAHGGRIDVESAVDQGSTFRVWLPVSR